MPYTSSIDKHGPLCSWTPGQQPSVHVL